MDSQTLTQQEAILDGLLGPAQIRIAVHGIHDLERDGEIIGVEALMRGPRGTPFETPPLAFAMAATLGMLERLDSRCIRLAASIRTEGLLFLNVHPRTLIGHEDFWATVGSFGGETSRPPSEVVFEIVEHSPARESDLANALRELRSLGFRIAVDDLGEGMSGLRRLVEIAPDFAKIDQFFTRDIDSNRAKRSVVSAIAAMGRDMGIVIIAEGVETENERSVLIDLGIPLAQGYIYGTPREVIG